MIPPPQARISIETISALRDSLERFVGNSDEDGELGVALARFATEARERGIPPESVLVELKTVWATLPAVTSRAVARSESTLLQRVVTLCIKSYYR